MKEMDDTVEISSEGAAKAADENAQSEDSILSDEQKDKQSDSTDSASEVEKLQAELRESKDRLLRQVAEFQNYRRRTEQEKSNLMGLGKEQVVKQILEVFDDLARSMDAAKQAEDLEEANNPAYWKLREGVELVYEKFSNELDRLGVVPIEAVGKPFNENEHEALMQQPKTPEIESGYILEEIQKGYKLGDKVLRHSRVIVAI